MHTFISVFLLGLSLLKSHGRRPEVPENGLFPFIVYFESHSRGMCVGSLVSPMAVLTAAVCVTDLNGELSDKPVTVVTGSGYRHRMRGIRVQVTKVVLPKLPDDIDVRKYMLQKSVALLLMKQLVPDVLAETPLRAIDVDYVGEDQLAANEECAMIGWHFYYAEDRLPPTKAFLLHRSLRYQMLQVAEEPHCNELRYMYNEEAEVLSEFGNFTENDVMCLRDPNNTAQPCHGMYGSPVVCSGGRVAGLWTAPGAQWTNCDRQSVLVHKLTGQQNKAFFQCVKPLLKPVHYVKWELLNKNKNTSV